MPKKLQQLHTRLHTGMLLDGMIAEVGEKAFAIYVIISIYADWHTGKACVAQSTIRRLTGITDHRTIRHHLNILVTCGYLQYEFRKMVVEGEEQGRKRYFFTLTWSAEDTFMKPK